MQVCVFAATRTFNRKVCGINDPSHPTRLSPSRKEWTLAALTEEVTEFADATNLVDEVDALIDLIYFASGRLQEMGVDGPTAFMCVHNANMGKERGEVARRPGSLGHDAIKPPGWQPPNYDWLEQLLMQVPKDHPGMGETMETATGDTLCTYEVGNYIHVNIDYGRGEQLTEAEITEIDPVAGTVTAKLDSGVEIVGKISDIVGLVEGDD